MKFDWWFSCKKITIFVVTDEYGKIVETAPIARCFVGQPVMNLFYWLQKISGKVRVVELKGDSE